MYPYVSLSQLWKNNLETEVCLILETLYRISQKDFFAKFSMVNVDIGYLVFKHVLEVAIVRFKGV